MTLEVWGIYLRKKENCSLIKFWVLLIFDKFACCRLIAKVRSQRRGDETRAEIWLTEGGKKVSHWKRKEGNKKSFQVGKKSYSSDEWTAKVLWVLFAEHGQSGTAPRNSPLLLNLQMHIRNLVKAGFLGVFWCLCFWQLSSSRKHEGRNSSVRYLRVGFSVCICSVLPGCQGSFGICLWNRSRMHWHWDLKLIL